MIEGIEGAVAASMVDVGSRVKIYKMRVPASTTS
jgi:hypothetical protein